MPSLITVRQKSPLWVQCKHTGRKSHLGKWEKSSPQTRSSARETEVYLWGKVSTIVCCSRRMLSVSADVNGLSAQQPVQGNVWLVMEPVTYQRRLWNFKLEDYHKLQFTGYTYYMKDSYKINQPGNLIHPVKRLIIGNTILYPSFSTNYTIFQ